MAILLRLYTDCMRKSSADGSTLEALLGNKAILQLQKLRVGRSASIKSQASRGYKRQ